MEDSYSKSEIQSQRIIYNYWDNKNIEKIFYTDKVFLEYLSTKISETRKDKGLTMEDLAKKANVSQLQIQNIENKIGEVDIMLFENVMNALDIKLKITVSFD